LKSFINWFLSNFMLGSTLPLLELVRDCGVISWIELLPFMAFLAPIFVWGAVGFFRANLPISKHTGLWDRWARLNVLIVGIGLGMYWLLMLIGYWDYCVDSAVGAQVAALRAKVITHLP